MAYSAGNLEVAITAISADALRSIDEVGKKLTSLSATLGAISKNDMKAVAKIGSTLRAITKIADIDKKFDKIDFNKVAMGFNNLSDAMTPFLNKVQKAEASLTSLYGILQKTTSKKIQGLNNFGSNGIGGGIGKLFGRVFTIATAVRLGRAVANIVQYGTDFTETLNLWQVAMRENLDQADEFIKKMNKAYSISQQTLMNAQAIFKNMIGSLGNISDQVAYQLSESIVQMAADFSSLYNTTFEQAITKFQAALAGQVRPIRSVSGYDITESTLYQVYQELGGTKTVRQLNRTEKQLLSIYAVFQQMQRSGAVGDLSKTLDNFANQSRMLNENFKELKTYVGLFFQDLLQSWGVMKYINATVIFLTEVVKALTKYEAPNFLEDMFESTVAENEAIDELQGKLLDFDKFRALDSTSTGSDLAIDQTILDAVSAYNSILEDVNNEARKIAESWLDALGILDMTEEKAQRIKDVLTAIGITLGVILGYSIIGGIKKLVSSLGLLQNGLGAVQILLVSGIIFAIVKAIEAFEKGDKVTGAIAITIGVVLVGALVAFKIAQHKANIATALLSKGIEEQNIFMQTLGLTTGKTAIAIKSVGSAALAAVAAFTIMDSVINGLDGTARQTVSIISIVVGALATLLGVILAIKGGVKGGLIGATIAGLGVGALLAGIKGVATKNSQIEYKAMGASDIDSGTLFVAGEAGKTEAVYTGANGKTNVANVQQMKAAFYQALVEYGQNHQDNQPIVVTLDGEVVYRSTTAHANRRGQNWAKG